MLQNLEVLLLCVLFSCVGAVGKLDYQWLLWNFPLFEGGLDPFYSVFFFFLKYVLLTNERRRVQLRCKVLHPGAGPPECLVQVMSSPQQRSACLLWLDSDFNRGRGLFWLQPQISANHLFFFFSIFSIWNICRQMFRVRIWRRYCRRCNHIVTSAY